MPLSTCGTTGRPNTGVRPPPLDEHSYTLFDSRSTKLFIARTGMGLESTRARHSGSIQPPMEVKGEGEEPLPISFRYKYIFITTFLFSYNKSVVTLLSPSPFTSLQIGQVPENWRNCLCGRINLPGGRAKKGRSGKGFCRLRRGIGILARAPRVAGRGLAQLTAANELTGPRDELTRRQEQLRASAEGIRQRQAARPQPLQSHQAGRVSLFRLDPRFGSFPRGCRSSCSSR